MPRSAKIKGKESHKGTKALRNDTSWFFTLSLRVFVAGLILLMAVLVLIPGEAFCGSPYSAVGLGFLMPDDTGISRSIGGAGVAVGEGVNMIRGNPALIGTFTSSSYSIATIYDRIQTYTGGSDRPIYGKYNLSLMKFVLPVWRGVIISWGLSPYSRTDVKIRVNSKPDDIFRDEMTSSGGINVSTFSLAASIRQRVYFGAGLNYYFGAIEENWKRTFPDNTDMNGTTDNLKKKYKGYSGTVGILFKPVQRTYVGIGYTSEADLDLDAVLQTGNTIDTEVLASSRGLKLPGALRFGVSSYISKRLMAACDYSMEQWESAARTPKEKAMYTDTWKIGGGLRFIPSTRINAPLLMKLPLSVGFRAGKLYYKSYPEIDAVTEKAVTFGVEIPVSRGVGRLYNTFELGFRGDKGSNGWEETFFSYSLSLVGVFK